MMKFATNGGVNWISFSGSPSSGINYNGDVFNLGGGVSGTGVTLRTAENLQTFQHSSFIYDWLEWTGGSSVGQGYTFHTYTHKNLLALDGLTGRVGIGTSSPTAMLHVTGAIYTETNITASGHVSASTYYGDGSNLTGISGGGSTFPYTGDASITGSLGVTGQGTFNNDVTIGKIGGADLYVGQSNLANQLKISSPTISTVRMEHGNRVGGNTLGLTYESADLDLVATLIA